MEWKKSTYSRNRIKTAGKILAKGTDDIFKQVEAIDVIDNWRAAHAYPLQVIASNLRIRTKDRKFVVVQRLKRLDSIIAKLKRAPWISLYDMQDLAGCRVIVPSIDEVYDVVREYRFSKIKHKFHHIDDYIDEPKKSGYRSLHMIYRYHSNKNLDYEGYFIEIQIRTKLQHLWSTAVETMGVYTGSNLKAGEGPQPVLRFFSLISSVFAILEKSTQVPDTPTDKKQLIDEIIQLCEKENLMQKLQAVSRATEVAGRKGNNARYYLLTLDFQTHSIQIDEYADKELQLATNAYKSIENDETRKNLNAVLVSARSITELKYAYPNYFSDISEFVTIVENIICKRENFFE